MQPHLPYLGTRAAELGHKVTEEHDVGFRYVEVMSEEDEQYSTEQIGSLLVAFERGYTSIDELKKPYAEDLRLVLEYAGKN